jgi:four helix bundle protein
LSNQNSSLKTQSQNSRVKIELRDRCFAFSIKVIKYVEKLPDKRIYWIISDQLLRSATSIGANIFEAKSASSKKDFIRFFEFALKSANETKYWLGILREIVSEDVTEINNILREVEEISKIVAASVLTMKGKNKV